MSLGGECFKVFKLGFFKNWITVTIRGGKTKAKRFLLLGVSYLNLASLDSKTSSKLAPICQPFGGTRDKDARKTPPARLF